MLSVKQVYSYMYKDHRGLFDVNLRFLSDSFDRDVFRRYTRSVVIDDEIKSAMWFVTFVEGERMKKKTMFMNVCVDEIMADVVIFPDTVAGKWKQPFSLNLYSRTGSITSTVNLNNPGISLKRKINNTYLFEIKYDYSDNR